MRFSYNSSHITAYNKHRTYGRPTGNEPKFYGAPYSYVRFYGTTSGNEPKYHHLAELKLSRG